MQVNIGKKEILIKKYRKYFNVNDIDLTNPVIVKNLMLLDIKNINLSPIIINFISNSNFLLSPNFLSELDTVIKAINTGDNIEAIYNVMTSINSINSKYRSLDIDYVLVNHSPLKALALSKVIASDIKRDHHYKILLDIINSEYNESKALMLSEIICMVKNNYRRKTELIEYLKVFSITDDPELEWIIKDTITDEYFMKQRYRSSLFSTIICAPDITMAKFVKTIICSEEGLKNKRLYYDIIKLYCYVDVLEDKNYFEQLSLTNSDDSLSEVIKNKQYSLSN